MRTSRIFSSILSAILILSFLHSCSDKPSPEDSALNISIGQASVPASAGSQFISITADGAWNLDVDATWVDLSKNSGSGDARVAVSYSENTETSSREAHFSLKQGSRSVSATLVQAAGSGHVTPTIKVTVTGSGSSDLEASSVKLGASYSVENGKIVSAGFSYGKSSSSLDKEAKTTDDLSGSKGDFSVSLSSLDPSTTYYYKPWVDATDEGGAKKRYEGTQASFTTEASSQSSPQANVTTGAASSVGSSSAILAGSFKDATSAVVEVGFEWGTSSTSMDKTLVGQDQFSSSDKSGEFTQILDELQASTTYYFRAYVVQMDGSTEVYSYGSTQSFKTEGNGKTLSVNVATGSATSITVSSAQLQASFSNANASIREVGFEWGTSSGSLSEVLQSSATFSSGTTSGSYDATLDGLGDNKTYYFRAYVVLQDGDNIQYFYGSVRSFKTESSGKTTSQAGWFELPKMNISEKGSYMVNSTDPDQYYAYHLCAGGEKNPRGGTLRNYTVCFSAKHHCPLWVAAPRHECFNGSSGRSESYKADPDIPADLQYNSKSTGGGCNKGHMLGSAERTSSKATNQQVFYYSNIAPQLSAGFNTGGGGWNLLEDWVDKTVVSDTLYEVIGCYFEKYTDGYGNTVSPSKISFGGRNDVSMPTMFYYVLLRTKKGNTGKSVKDCSASELQCVAMVRCHTNNLKGQKPTYKEMMSVADLERITGVTYFPNVPNAPKSTYSASDWGL